MFTPLLITNITGQSSAGHICQNDLCLLEQMRQSLV